MFVELEVFLFSELTAPAKEKVRYMLDYDGAHLIAMSWHYEEEQIDDYLESLQMYYTADGFEIARSISEKWKVSSDQQ